MNYERLMTIIKTFIYVVEDCDCQKCPCKNTKYCKYAKQKHWKCEDGIYEWLMDY